MTIEKLTANLGLVLSTACKKVNTVGTDGKLFRLVPVPGHSTQVLPLEAVSARARARFPDLCLGTN